MSPADDHLDETVRREVERALQPLRNMVSAQQAELARLAATVWALDVANGVLRGLVPAGRAGDAAEAVEAALKSASKELRDSAAGKELQAWCESLRKTHRYTQDTFGDFHG